MRIRKLLNLLLLSLIILPWQYLIYFRPGPVEALTHSITSKVDFNGGNSINTESVSKEGEVKLKTDVTWNARVFKTPKMGLSNQTGIVSDGNYIYALFNSDRYFSRYLPDEDRWQELAKAPHTSYGGTDLVFSGNYIYAIYGGYQKEFSRYTISTNTWEDLASAPDLFLDGSALGTDGTYVYASRGGWTTDFWRYDPSSDAWTIMANSPAGLQQGSDILYSDGALYVPRGYYNNFYKYDIASNTWSSLANIPADLVVMYGNHNLGINSDYIYFTRDYSNTQTFYRYKISDDTWEQLTNLPQTTGGVGNVYNAADGYLYVFRGNGTYDFWKYDINSNTFVGNADLLLGPASGADLVYYDGYLYSPRGANTLSFSRYNLTTNTWESRADSPVQFNDDTKGVVAGNYLYFFRGSNTNGFYRYDPVGNSWTTLTATTPATSYYGGTLVYPGTGDFIYATRGATTRSFWRYQISTDTWSDLDVADLPDDSEAGYGARLVTDGTDIYYSAGSGIPQLLKYTILTDTWEQIGSVPFAPYWGTDATYYNGKIYFQAGNFKGDVWEYTIAGNTWRWLGQMGGYGPTEIALWNGGSLESDGTGNFYSIYGNGITRLTSFTPNANNYVGSGTWTSGAIDLSYVTGWTSLTSSVLTPGDSSIAFETRTSADRVTWSDWQAVNTGTILSPAARYIQIKATFASTTDQSQTPVLYSLSVNYTGDGSAPTNPSSFTGKSRAVGGVSLVSGSSYSYHQPYFTWSGASDSETSVSGYYVYFGENSSADPATAGNYQTTANYTTTLQMTTGTTYYLRLKTKDEGGNVSAATTGFSYIYAGVSPPQSITQTTSEDFSTGTATDVTIIGDNIKLSNKDGFWQEERLSLSPAGVYYGSDFAYVASTNKLYRFRGYNTTTFYEYDITSDVWTTKANAPEAVYQGASLVEGPDGYLYALRATNTNKFWRYDIAADSWNDVDANDMPQTAYHGADLVYDGSRYIYATRGINDDAFYRYDTQLNLWEQKANTDFNAPASQVNNFVNDGGDLVYDGQDTIYAIQGGGRSGFAAYSISGDSWTVLINTPSISGMGARISYDSTTNAVYHLAGNNDPFMYKYDIASQTWVELTEAPITISAGSTLRNIDGTLYMMRGGGGNNFYKYNITKDSWMIPNTNLFGDWFRGSYNRAFSYGADIVKGDGDNYYMTRGNYDNLFIRYNGVTGEATKMADAPVGPYYGSDLVYDSTNNKIYMTGGVYYRRLFVYDVATDAWSEEVSDPPPFDTTNGSAMAYDGSRYIYWSRGGSNTFQRFDTQGTAGAKWSSLVNTPGSLGWGSDMVVKDDYIYVLRGSNTLSFYRYGPLSDSPVWSDPAVADLPTGGNVNNEGFLVDGGSDYLYACRGGNQVGCYRYSITGDSWEAIANAPANIYLGAGAASNGTDKIFMIPGGSGTNTFQNGLYTYVMQTDNSSFEDSGSYISPSHDLTSTYRYANISVTYTSANNTSLTVYTSTSSDNSNWSDWSEASEVKSVGTTYTYKINSAANRYLKIKFILESSDGIYSGSISDYTVYYYQDIDSPTNPTALEAYTTSTQSAEITTNTWYNYPSPNFDWPDADEVGGATDGSGGSGVAGYYVYFGPNASADASTSGTLTTNSSYTASSLTSGETYYLRIQAIDDDGNFSTANWQPFIYKFDNVAPSNPVTISVNPPGYTSVNDFDFTLKGATDSASLIGSYCYKYKTSEDDGEFTYSDEICITEMDLNGTATASGILAYDSGEDNTFYVRSKDRAGNYASNYATQIYKYSGKAPSKPTDLRVTYPSDGSDANSVNEFAFAWDPPASYSGAQTGLRYYYSINALPNGNNVNEIGLADTYLSTGGYATQRGDNILYVVAKDEAGNIDYTNYARVTFTADTSAPGIARNIDISDVSIKETSSWRLALSWDTPEATGSGVANYRIYRSAVEDSSCNSNYADFNYVASTTQTSYVDTGLTQTKKYYCVKACDSTNECSAVSDTVGLYPDGRWRVAPDLLSDPTVSVKTKSAIVTWSTSRTSNSFVKFGKNPGNYGEEVGSSTQVAAHTISLTGLDPGTTYYYVAQWTDEDGNSGSSDEFSFTTSPAPYVSSVKFSGVNINSLYVNFTIANAVKATLHYGKTTDYGGSESISTSTTESTYTIALSNLTEGTLHHLKITGEDAEGNAYDSDDYTFETLPTPKIIGLKVQQVAGMPTATLRLLWTSNTLVSSIVTYYPTSSPEKAVDQISLTLKKNHEVILKNLIDSTDYTIDIKGKDSAGNAATSVTRKLKTSQDIRAPEIQNMNVESTIVGVGETAKAQIVVSWDTDEPATTQVEYAQGTGTAYGLTTQEDSALTTNHTVTITGLTPAKIYHLRAISKDKVGNIGQSFDTVIITPKSTKDALNLVIDNLSATFGFLNNLKIGR